MASNFCVPDNVPHNMKMTEMHWQHYNNAVSSVKLYFIHTIISRVYNDNMSRGARDPLVYSRHKTLQKACQSNTILTPQTLHPPMFL